MCFFVSTISKIYYLQSRAHKFASKEGVWSVQGFWSRLKRENGYRRFAHGFSRNKYVTKNNFENLLKSFKPKSLKYSFEVRFARNTWVPVLMTIIISIYSGETRDRYSSFSQGALAKSHAVIRSISKTRYNLCIFNFPVWLREPRWKFKVDAVIVGRRHHVFGEWNRISRSDSSKSKNKKFKADKKRKTENRPYTVPMYLNCFLLTSALCVECVLTVEL